MKKLICRLVGHNWQPQSSATQCAVRCARCGSLVDLLAQAKRRIS